MIKSLWKFINIIAISHKRGMEQAEIIDTFWTYHEANPRQANQDDDDPMFPHIARGAGDQHPKANDEQDEEEPVNEENADPEGNAYPEGDAGPEGNDPEEEPEPQFIDNALTRVRRRVDVDSIREEIQLPGRPTARSRT